jgi:hypothetical protein
MWEFLGCSVHCPDWVGIPCGVEYMKPLEMIMWWWVAWPTLWHNKGFKSRTILTVVVCISFLPVPLPVPNIGWDILCPTMAMIELPVGFWWDTCINICCFLGNKYFMKHWHLWKVIRKLMECPMWPINLHSSNWNNTFGLSGHAGDWLSWSF